jgi:colicin import membrane protein
MRVMVAIVLIGSAARADDSRLREALRITVGQLHALEDEQAQWKSKEGEYQKQIAALKAQLAAVPAPVVRKCDDRKLREQFELEKTQLTKQLAQCASEADERAKSAASEKEKLGAQLEQVSSKVSSCEAKNAKLFATGEAILGWLDNVRTGEPFLNLKRVELENTAQDYDDKLRGERIR